MSRVRYYHFSTPLSEHITIIYLELWNYHFQKEHRVELGWPNGISNSDNS